LLFCSAFLYRLDDQVSDALNLASSQQWCWKRRPASVPQPSLSGNAKLSINTLTGREALIHVTGSETHLQTKLQVTWRGRAASVAEQRAVQAGIIADQKSSVA